MAAERKEKFSGIWKIATLMELYPSDVQDMVYQTDDDVTEDFDKLKWRILTWVSSKVVNFTKLVPMDVGSSTKKSKANISNRKKLERCARDAGIYRH